jgi:hypothetical protein
MLPETLVRDSRRLDQAALQDYIGSLNPWAHDPRSWTQRSDTDLHGLKLSSRASLCVPLVWRDVLEAKRLHLNGRSAVRSSGVDKEKVQNEVLLGKRKGELEPPRECSRLHLKAIDRLLWGLAVAQAVGNAWRRFRGFAPLFGGTVAIGQISAAGPVESTSIVCGQSWLRWHLRSYLRCRSRVGVKHVGYLFDEHVCFIGLL